MTGVAVIGTQWGDEGKGKIVDWLSERADVVVRFQGGHNAGHTLVINGKIHKLSLLPAGVVRPGKLSLIGNGVVLDPWAFLAEVAQLRGQGVAVAPDNLRIADNAALILPLHREIDAAREAAKTRLGTTGRGIGPAYEDKIARRAVRAGDLADLKSLPGKLDRLLAHHNALRRGLSPPRPEIDRAQLAEALAGVAPQIRPYLDAVWLRLDEARRAGRRILFEGAQGLMLDVDHGTYPFVTSSNTVAGAASAGAGVGPDALSYVLGLAKAYTTRVGEGPFPTEQDNQTGALLGERGAEFGTVTGRRRRCGWFDAVLVRQAVKIAGVSGIALTKLDVLDTLDEIKICTAYKLAGARRDYLPSEHMAQAALEPVYETLAGWKQSTRAARFWRDLPAQAVKYVRMIEELVGAPVALLSTSPEREDTILMRDPFAG